MQLPQIPIIDSHLDLALNALHLNRDLCLDLDELNKKERGMNDHLMRGRATLTLPELRAAGVRVCVATVLARYTPGYRPGAGYSRMDIDFAAPAIAHADARGQLAYYEALEQAGEIRFIATGPELSGHLSQVSKDDSRPPLGIILGMEGADPILSPEDAEKWFSMGLRVAGLCHYGRGLYAAGTGTPGPLTKAGKALLGSFRRLGIILDLSHLADQAFQEVLEIFDGPVMASHNNCRALVPGDRQYADSQIQAIVERDGIIGVAFDAWMLSDGWIRGKSDPATLGMAAVVDHMDHICQLAGDSRHVALGTDLDGGFGTEQTPGDLKRYDNIRGLVPIMESRGYDMQAIENIFWRNWHDFFLARLPQTDAVATSSTTDRIATTEV